MNAHASTKPSAQYALKKHHLPAVWPILLALLFNGTVTELSAEADPGENIPLHELKKAALAKDNSPVAHICPRLKTTVAGQDVKFVLRLTNDSENQVALLSPLPTMKVVFFTPSGKRLKPPLSAYTFQEGEAPTDIIPPPIRVLSPNPRPRILTISPRATATFEFVLSEKIKDSLRVLLRDGGESTDSAHCQILFSLIPITEGESYRILKSEIVTMPIASPDR